jgi:FG-GAP repeat
MASATAVAHAQLPVQQLLPSPVHPDDGFGWFADIEGDTAAVFQRGQYWGPKKPATYSYRRVEGSWRLEQRLPATPSLFETETGPLTLSREWLAVGVPQYAPSGLLPIGGVHLFQRGQSGWELKQLVYDATLGPMQWMGVSLSLDDRRLAVGAYGGYAYIYELQQLPLPSWELAAKLPDPSEGTQMFGWAVALDDTTLVVGARALYNFKPGTAYVFELIQGNWQQVQRLDPDDREWDLESFGERIALSGTHCLVGSPLGDGWQGFVYAFEQQDGFWQLRQKLRALDRAQFQRFGQAIALSGDNAVIAAAGPGATPYATVAYQFQFREGAWAQIGKLVIDGSKSSIPVGGVNADVALSGWTALLTSPDDILAVGSGASPNGVTTVFELAPDATQYCLCLPETAPCGAPDGDAGCTNSTGSGAMLNAGGLSSASTDEMRMQSRWMPRDVVGLFVMGPQAAETPIGDGFLCVGAGDKGLFRFPANSTGARGMLSLGPGIVAYSHAHFPTAGHIEPGDTWYFQAWYRDPNGPCGRGFNLSNGLKVDFTQ